MENVILNILESIDARMSRRCARGEIKWPNTGAEAREEYMKDRVFRAIKNLRQVSISWKN